jgi:ABC-type sugar transport system ATPase subunit
MDEPVLWCKDLRKRFKERLAVDGVGFEVAAGETYGLLGPNGAGKTTTISMICGLLRRDGGEVTVAGVSLDDDPGRVKAAIGYVPQDVALYPDLSGLENLRFWGRMYGLAGVVVPAGYGQDLRAGRDAEVGFVVDQTRPAPAPVRSAAAAVVARQAGQVRAARFAATEAGVGFDAALARARALADGQPQVRVDATTVGGRTDALPTGFNYTAPANLVLFVFITSLAGAAGLIEARRLG